MRNLMKGLTGTADETPLDAAQEVMLQAYAHPDPAGQAALAKQALTISPDFADAYTLLAELAESRQDALDLYRQAVAAGERDIGPASFRDDVGYFWGLLETRPYMRARAGLARALWALRQREDAVEHLRDMLRLNPNDNQGVRFTLTAWLLNLDRDEELAQLLQKYDAPVANWTCTKALLAFRRQGDSPEARRLLKQAHKQNNHMRTYLAGEAPLPAALPNSYTRGEQSEAAVYAFDHLSAWKSTPGAITWLCATLKGQESEPAESAPTTGLLDIAAEKLLRLPQRIDTWQADCRQIAKLLEEGGRLIQPWITLVVRCSDGMILAQTIGPEPPSPAQVWALLAKAMETPEEGKPHRPNQLRVRPGSILCELRPLLETIEVEYIEDDELDDLEVYFDGLTEHLTEDEEPGLLDTPGVTPERVASFYRAAAAFYRKAPWKNVSDEDAIQIECDQLEGGPWYAVVMGWGGITIGLGLFEDLDLLRRMWGDDHPDQENAGPGKAVSVTFDPETQIPAADLLAARQHGWEVAGPEAYPWAFRTELGPRMVPPAAWELELLEGCLRAIPKFVAENLPRDLALSRTTVSVASGKQKLKMVLSWVEDE
jgi:tetratricopeptide (TPR) repeat protein